LLFYYLQEEDLLIKNRQLILLLLFLAVTIMLQIIEINCHCLHYNRKIFLSNIYYMGLTPNLVHANWMHWFLNVINMLALVLIFYKTWSIKRFIFFMIFASYFVTICIYIFLPNVTSYLGLSGVLYGAAVYSGLNEYNEQKTVSILLLSYVLLKLLFHDFINEITYVDDMLNGLTILTQAHWYGAIFGVLVYIVEIKK